ncbi:heparin-sulfate lyase HepC [uncultured Alistipes sp.]|uniref:heparin-sulfate lyase HepC n=1 Tax=uncultured Alistipes sp. TaxID=538949 RepID=UPI00261E5735|nr:heparin-sulfate lyase HepC [uncultured Alistipes sp.]
MKLSKLLTALLFAALPLLSRAQADTTLFALLDLSRPGLERVAALHAAGDDAQAAEALLDYYRHRTEVVCPDVDTAAIVITPGEQRWADEALEHRFFVHTGYQPSYFYGDDIDWQYWPVRDNELRWQLHRMKWWVPMGKAYRLSHDERYAAEWCAEYLDWMRKNPLTEYDERKACNWTEAENVYFAWRPLEVSDRLEFQIHQFIYFLPSEHFTADFLLHFLENYHRHAEHITRHFSASGNHLLFQAQRLIFAGVFFPEFRDAARWRATGVEILNREIGKQVYDDGMQYELDPHYHLESINIFFKALRMMDANGYRGDFPAEYLATVERMITVHMNYSFPDYTVPMFSDAKLHDRTSVLPSYREWTEVFPANAAIRRLATEGREGAAPDYRSRAFRTSGFYVLRNGWEEDATVMVLKAGPQAFWHCQPDNGTFELWCRGRNFFPDSGSFVYAGDKEVTAQRNWFRRTAVHNTLTLDDRNLDSTASRCLRWSTAGDTDLAVVENPSYEGLTHRRAVFFVDRTFYVIVDEAWGDAAGDVALHYHLVECDPAEDAASCSVATRFDDGNNLLLRVFGAERMERTEGWVSRTYRQRTERPAYAFRTQKRSGEAVRFITVLLPAGNAAAHAVEASFRGRFSERGCTLRVKVDGRKYDLKYEL